MRISSGRSWLAVAALALGTAEAAFVTFTDADFKGSWVDTQAIIYFPTGTIRTFKWTTDNIVVDEIRLWTYIDGKPASAHSIQKGTNQDSPYPLSSTTSSLSATQTPNTPQTPGGNTQGQDRGGRIGQPRGLQTREENAKSTDAVDETLLVHSNLHGGNVTIQSIKDITVSKPLWFEAIWANGRSYSRLFTLVTELPPGNDAPITGWVQNANLSFNSSSYLPEETSSNDGQSTGTGGGQPTGTVSGEAASSAPPASGSGGGLQSGAVIGIAIACGAVGLILVFALVWFLLRRRQKQKAMHPVDSAYGSGNRTDELMAEKEAGADVDVTPHSPYSDDGAPAPGPSGAYQDGAAAPHEEPVAAGAVAAAAAAAHHPHHQHQQDQGRSFTPYSDRPSGGAAGTPSVRAASVAQADEPRVSVPSATPGRAPRGR
ncbi:hypothetical protein NEMBOFW57_002297 [Staphylotrichum longicolle]|uniref:Mid2 domain-containing protein n=1 Tax=Staphylotrichum longicolle TaxID=669026 RepID=A0AAD4I1M6_9PEZI|nr:hypothetical protein NEMBOFW57_002297 [Staphylotrichum longicolle]